MPSAPEFRWFAEFERVGVEQRVTIRDLLYEGDTGFQHIRVLDSIPFGRILVLDIAIQTTEADEFIYHEMIVHPALIALERPERVLIIGGGDGGCLRRVLEHPVQRAVMVEIDAEVVEVCRRYLPTIAGDAFADPRAELIIADGYQYVRETPERFDAIIVDCTDPWPPGPSQTLFSLDFYRAVAAVLKDEGIMVTQASSPLYLLPEVQMIHHQLGRAFPQVGIYLAAVPSYPGTLWAFAFGGKGNNPAALPPAEVERRLRQRRIQAHYYRPQVHSAAFCLPAFLVRALADRQFRPQRYHLPVRYDLLLNPPA